MDNQLLDASQREAEADKSDLPSIIATTFFCFALVNAAAFFGCIVYFATMLVEPEQVAQAVQYQNHLKVNR